MIAQFRNQKKTKKKLTTQLAAYANRQDDQVLALPRGGVPVAFEIAKALHAPLDVFIVRKLGVPGHEELAMGAIATGGIRVLNDIVLKSLLIPDTTIASVTAKEEQELERREHLYRDDRPAPDIRDSTVIIVDDGLATGATMRAAIVALQQQHPARIIVAVPVASPVVCNELGAEVDEIICARTPEPFYGVGFWYVDFAQTTDQDVHALLERAANKQFTTSSQQQEKELSEVNNTSQVQIATDTALLEGNLVIPENPHGVVLFSHGSGSGRHSPRNQSVAATLQKAGFATLLIDLLTTQEEQQDQPTGHLRFDIDLLSQRVIAATNWLAENPTTSTLKIGLFGASTGAAAALVAAAERPLAIGAVVSRGGRPDLAGSSLTRVETPTLLIVGSKDTQVIELNRMALTLLRGEKQIEIVEGATHLFEEPGTLEKVAQLASEWFTHYLS
ncbi:MAG: dienelactone hydrolase family protein [Chloroflexota bacterium]|nr:dienelactone hydrolase family protein [Chloroflexota bacterium]